MPTFFNNGFRLFKVFGIDVYLHWSWLLVAAYEIQLRKGEYSSLSWNIGEYLSLFAIVLLHEFGHALACRSVGGTANKIMLWPLGGVAYVSPPPRPGAQLWSIVAGPLVNVMLLVTLPFLRLPLTTDLHIFLFSIARINLLLLIFNLVPIYPLDGGQILRSLLWFVLGRGTSLLVSSVIGMAGAAAIGLWAITQHNDWFIVLGAFGAMYSYQGFKSAKAIRYLESLPRRGNVACPSCHAHPPVGNFWGCGKCGTQFDTFEYRAICPACGMQFQSTRCSECGASAPMEAWEAASPYTDVPANG